MRNGKRSVAVAVALVALLGAACGGDDGGETESAGGGSTTLTAADFAWDPATVTATAGGSIEVANEDDAKHNLTVEEAGVDEDVEPGGTVTVDLSGVEAGGYDFFCEYHPDMKGTLEVE